MPESSKTTATAAGLNLFDLYRRNVADLASQLDRAHRGAGTVLAQYTQDETARILNVVRIERVLPVATQRQHISAVLEGLEDPRSIEKSVLELANLRAKELGISSEELMELLKRLVHAKVKLMILRKRHSLRQRLSGLERNNRLIG